MNPEPTTLIAEPATPVSAFEAALKEALPVARTRFIACGIRKDFLKDAEQLFSLRLFAHLEEATESGNLVRWTKKTVTQLAKSKTLQPIAECCLDEATCTCCDSTIQTFISSVRSDLGEFLTYLLGGFELDQIAEHMRIATEAAARLFARAKKAFIAYQAGADEFRLSMI